MLNRKQLVIILGVVIVLAATYLWVNYGPRDTSEGRSFDGDNAMQHLVYQVNLGPRTVGSKAHDQAVEYFRNRLKKARWEVSIQETTYGEHNIQNLIAKRGSGSPWTVIGAHYDSRLLADQDQNPNNRTEPVPGANDGASGAAVILELAESLPDKMKGSIWMVLFDAEDNGEISGWDWTLGAEAFVASLQSKPDAAVILDMIGDSDLNIYMERNSNADITRQIWLTAATEGYTNSFIQEYRYSMLDDHTPFLQAGIPAVDIIDFDYPYWHTTQDTIDKVSAQSLKTVGVTVQKWLNGRHAP